MANSISAMGIGSGLDIQGLIQQLMDAESKPKIDALNKKEANYQAKISVLGTLKAAMFDLQGTLTQLKLQGTFFSYGATVSDSTLFTASVKNGDSIGNHTVEVMALARAHTLTTASYADTTSALVGAGTLTFDFGGVNGGVFTANATTSGKTVTITDGSLAGVRDAINKADIGVTANIVYNGAGYQLVLASATGASNTLRITVADGDGNNTDMAGLSGLAFDPVGATKNLTQMVAAQDASARIDGITVTNSSNTLTDILSGVEISLKREAAGTVATMSIATDSVSAETAIGDFVDKYNALMKTLKDASYFDKDTKTSGTLIGDPIIWGVQQGMNQYLTKTIGDSTTKYRNLSSLGISFDKQATLTFNKSKFKAAFADKPLEVQRLFGGGSIPNSNSTISGLNWLATTTGFASGSIGVDITRAATSGRYATAALGVGVTFPYTTSATANVDETFSIRVDGIISSTLNMPANATYATGGDLALAVQSIINNDAALKMAKKSVTVSYDGANYLTIKSNSLGGTSTVAIIAASANMNTNYGIGAGTSTAGLDVQGTIGGIAATGSGTTLSGTGFYSGTRVKYQGSSTGSYLPPKTTVTGFAFDMAKYVDGYMKFDGGVMNSRVAIYNDDIKQINKDREALDRHLQRMRDTLIQQFSAMDSLVGRLNSLGSYLSNQFNNNKK